MENSLSSIAPDHVTAPVVPAVWADLVRRFEILLGRLTRGRPGQALVVVSQDIPSRAGLLEALRERAHDQGWAVAELTARHGSETDFRRMLSDSLAEGLHGLAPQPEEKEATRRAAGALSSFRRDTDPCAGPGSFKEPALVGLADSGVLSLDLTDAVVAVGEAAQAEGRGMVLLLEGLQVLESAQLEALVAALHKAVQRGLPLTLVAFASPSIRVPLGETKPYAERLFHFVEA